MRDSRAALALAACLGLASCSPSTGILSQSALPATGAGSVPMLAAGRYIKHIVLVIQENRTFDNIFNGYPGADTQPFGYTHTGKKIRLTPIPYAGEHDMSHNYTPAWIAVDGGKMDGFDLNTYGSGTTTYPYSYLERSQVATYWAMAHDYELLDHMFPTELGPSFTSHLNLIAGTDDLKPNLAEANYPTGEPWGCDAFGGKSVRSFTVDRKRQIGDGPFPCFTQFRTLADVLDAKHVSWKYYAPSIDSSYGGGGGQLWTAFDAIKKVRYGPDWRNVVNPQTRILSDATAGRLAGMTWVVPDWLDSDWPNGSDTGPSWVASIVNAIGKGPDWRSTAIIVVWDDWGGWYDNVPPPVKDFRGLGIRVPCLVISPYVKRGTVVHTEYEFGSILKFVEQTFGLPPIGPASAGYTDSRATSLATAFDFTQKPRAFVPIPHKYAASYFVTRPPSGHWVDDQ
jgi:phospholipase C